MGLAFTATLAFCLWVFLWAIGVKGFDGMLITLVIIVVATTVKSLTRFMPGAGRARGGDGGW
ncbi:MAG TPA: hypothetical protein VFV85_08195 [Conexibacter sp.]|nr:hypothetical protein [Conexibacter sp.]